MCVMEHLTEKLELKLLAQITRTQQRAHIYTHAQPEFVHTVSRREVNGFPVVTFLCNKMTSANQMCLRACVLCLWNCYLWCLETWHNLGV